MKTYNVKQIADMLGNNPETVRRWIRDDKLKAVQVSRKGGNVVTEAELKRFLETTPKYLSKFTTSLAAISPMIGIGALAGGIIASVLLRYYNEKGKMDDRAALDDLKKYLKNDIGRLENIIAQKEKLIQQMQEDIMRAKQQVELYRQLLNNRDLLEETIKKQQGKESKLWGI